MDAVLAAAPGEGLQTRELVSTYFDTPDGALSERHMSLRLRKADAGPAIQTFKCGQGLSRQELEWPAPDGLDRTHPGLRDLLKGSVRKALAPAFTVTINRRQRTLNFRESQIELALDQGQARRGDQSRHICEVELELKAGLSADLFELARQLSQAAPLRLSFLGKASQGQLLVQPAVTFSQETAPVITRDTSPQDAFQALARRALVDLALHAEAYSDQSSARALHALRVSARHLKSYLTTFSPLLQEVGAKAMRRHINWLLQVTAEARNIDVFTQVYGQAGAPNSLAEALKSAAHLAHAKTQGALASKRFRDLLLDLAAWVETDAWRIASEKPPLGRLRPFAKKCLDRALKALRRRAGDLRSQDADARHQVRLKIKRLRYILEAFAPLFATKGANGYLKALKTIQSDLGDLNDAAVAWGLIEALGLDQDIPQSRDLVQARIEALEARLPSTNRKLASLLRQPGPWSI